MCGAFTCRYGHAPLTHIRNSTGPQSYRLHFAVHTNKYAELNLQIRTPPVYFNVKAKLSIIAALPRVFNRNCF